MLVVFRVVRPSKAGAESKVSELDVTHLVNQNVVGLDVAVDEAHLVHAVHGADQLTDVEPDVSMIISDCSRSQAWADKN